MSILVSAVDDRWRPAAHPASEVGGLLDRPPTGEAHRSESNFLPLWPRSRELRHHGERRGGQNLPRVLPLESKQTLCEVSINVIYLLDLCFLLSFVPFSIITLSQQWIHLWALWFSLCVWRKRRTSCGSY